MEFSNDNSDHYYYSYQCYYCSCCSTQKQGFCVSPSTSPNGMTISWIVTQLKVGTGSSSPSCCDKSFSTFIHDTAFQWTVALWKFTLHPEKIISTIVKYFRFHNSGINDCIPEQTEIKDMCWGNQEQKGMSFDAFSFTWMSTPKHETYLIYFCPATSFLSTILCSYSSLSLWNYV